MSKPPTHNVFATHMYRLSVPFAVSLCSMNNRMLTSRFYNITGRLSDMKCGVMNWEVMSSNPGRAELGVRSTSALSRT